MPVLNGGVWPVMLTPFKNNGSLDLEGLCPLVSWYISQGCDGLFAVCQSSEMFYLSLDERVRIAREVVRLSAGKIPVLASGHVSIRLKDQAAELNAIADCGVDGLVLVTNRLVSSPQDDDQTMLQNLRLLLSLLPKDIPLGFYECPYPFKRLLPANVLQFCLDSGRFHFIKDTSCNILNIREKLRILRGSSVMLYNANTATLLDSLEAGVHGYTGVMANFHPRLYRWLTQHWKERPQQAREVQAVLSMCALIELKKYPSCAKRYLRTAWGLPIDDTTRKDNGTPLFFSADDTELMQLKLLSDKWEARLLENCAAGQLNHKRLRRLQP